MAVRGTRKKHEEDGAPTATVPTAARLIITPTLASVLAAITGPRLLDLCRLLGCEVRATSGGKEGLVAKLAAHMGDRLPAVLRELGRDELRAVCRRHDLDPSARARVELQALILTAAGLDPASASVRPAAAGADGLPGKGHARGSRTSLSVDPRTSG